MLSCVKRSALLSVPHTKPTTCKSLPLGTTATRNWSAAAHVGKATTLEIESGLADASIKKKKRFFLGMRRMRTMLQSILQPLSTGCLVWWVACRLHDDVNIKATTTGPCSHHLINCCDLLPPSYLKLSDSIKIGKGCWPKEQPRCRLVRHSVHLA
jgi:hypothetical protein